MSLFPSFDEYFEALWGCAPFPWQSMLAERVVAGHWPQVLDLPTGAGKTACIDIAVYALAAQATRPLTERTAARRIWFTVDRRIVVDDAFARAAKIAATLREANAPPLHAVAERLRSLSGTGRPLAVARLRGGIFRDDGWARIPSQPAIITSTVDQLGSRLLFRGYGHSLSTASIFAGLAAHDSLILLDEAHCAVPFMQTLRAIARYRGSEWAEHWLATPFGFVILSATPPAGIPNEHVFPGAAREAALAHPELQRRLGTKKAAELVMVPASRPTGRQSEAEADPLVQEAVRRALEFVGKGRQRVAVMVNRVHTAERIAECLRRELDIEADVVLLTGRMRPFDRDTVVERWRPYLEVRSATHPQRPVLVVATQCLEVGADFDFDALVTECASLDALRQRFGRLARAGADEVAPAAIVVREADLKSPRSDPVYGNALKATWEWLCQAAEDADGRRTIDLGVDALAAKLRDVEALAPLVAPSPDAPTLLPAHLDLLCQTAPLPYPEPDVSLYLHGQPAPPQVAVVWRCDLPVDRWHLWAEIVALCPPVSGEMLDAPLWRVRAWLAQQCAPDSSPDVEGAGEADQEQVERIRPCLLWRGRDRSRIARNARDIVPGDVLVVPAAYGIAGLGQAVDLGGLGSDGFDVWERARDAAGQAPAVRIHPSVLAPWLACPPLAQLVERATSPAWDRKTLQDAMQAVLDDQPPDGESSPAPPAWWRDLLHRARHGRIEDHPAGGIVVIGRAALADAAELDLFADDDDLLSTSGREVALEDHVNTVRRVARRLAGHCVPESLRSAIEEAAYWHDAGKLDQRFQLVLHQGDEVAAAVARKPLAKSTFVPPSPARRRAIREAAGLPEGFRHEMLSAQLAERYALPTADAHTRDLVLHLVASHHGYARPFAPLCEDQVLPAVTGVLGEIVIDLSADERRALPPSHRLDSGIAERFWRLNRRYGWWGLAYLEALVRLADWYGSRVVVEGERVQEEP